MIEQRGYHFKDLRVAAFYVIINYEIKKMLYREEVTFDDLYNAICRFAEYCCKLNPTGELKHVLHNIIANQENDIEKVYSVLSIG